MKTGENGVGCAIAVIVVILAAAFGIVYYVSPEFSVSPGGIAIVCVVALFIGAGLLAVVTSG